MPDLTKKAVMIKLKRQDKHVKAGYLKAFEMEVIPEYIDSIMDEYDSELVGPVTDRRSKTNPLYYRDEFREALENYNYVTVEGKTTRISLPDMETFPWTIGRLRVIENILEGIIGIYIEVDEEQYVALYTKRPLIEPYDKTVARKQRIYLLKFNSNLNRLWATKFPKDRPVRYPFSNMPSIDIFSGPNTMFVEELQEWLPRVINKKSKEISR
jgi:hypothetical protein